MDEKNSDIITTTKSDIEKAVDSKANSKTSEAINELSNTIKDLINSVPKPVQQVPDVIKNNLEERVYVKDVKHRLGIIAIAGARADYSKGKTSFSDQLKQIGIDERQIGSEILIKSVNASILDQGGILIPEIWADEVIPMLNANTVIRKAGANVMEMTQGNLKFRQILTNPTMYWRGESGSRTKSEPTFGDISMTSKIGYVQVPVTDQWLRYAGQKSAKMVQDTIMEAISLGEDYAFVYGSGSVNQPLGIQGWIASANKFAMTGTPTAITKRADLLKMKKYLLKNNIKGNKVCWLMHPSVENDLETQVGTDYHATDYAISLSQSGKLFGYPVFTTTQIPFVSTTSVFLVDISYCIIGEGNGATLKFKENGSYYDGSNTVSGDVTGESVFTAEEELDFVMTSTLAGVELTGVTWGL